MGWKMWTGIAVVAMIGIGSMASPETADPEKKTDASSAASETPTPVATTPEPTPVATTEAPVAAALAASPTPTKKPKPKAPKPDCQEGYSPCLPVVADLNCPDIGHPVTVTGSDPYKLDRDGDCIGCD